ncbi:MAG TPA: cupin domain-containing protein [Candidatus Brocadiia bacterium]|nr:cupin domain-containing protein [Candidatus Brocadiia bacterium]
MGEESDRPDPQDGLGKGADLDGASWLWSFDRGARSLSDEALPCPDGKWEKVTLGPDLAKGHVTQKGIPFGTWKGFVLRPAAEYDGWLDGVTVSPRFHVDDREMARKPEEMRQVLKNHPTAIPRTRAMELCLK